MRWGSAPRSSTTRTCWPPTCSTRWGSMELVSFIEAKFGIEVADEDLLPENFKSVDAHRRLRRRARGAERRVLMELLYTHAEAEPDHDRGRLPRRAAQLRPSWSSGSSGSRAASPGTGSAPATRSASSSATTPGSSPPSTRSPRSARSVVPANPAFKQAELDFWFRSTGVRAVISDERTAGVCERIVAGFDYPAAGDRLRRRPRPVGDPRRPGRGGQRRAAAPRVARRAVRRPVLLRLDRSSEARSTAPTASASPRPSPTSALGLTAEDKILAAVPLFHTWGMGACIFGAAVSGATLVILEDPHPFLLKRHRALELIEQRARHGLPGRPLQLPADGRIAGRRRPLLAAPLLHRRDGDAASRPSRPSASASASSCASSTARPRPG